MKTGTVGPMPSNEIRKRNSKVQDKRCPRGKRKRPYTNCLMKNGFLYFHKILLAKILSVSPLTIHRWIQKGWINKVPFYSLGKVKVYYSDDESITTFLLRWEDNRRDIRRFLETCRRIKINFAVKTIMEESVLEEFPIPFSDFFERVKAIYESYNFIQVPIRKSVVVKQINQANPGGIWIGLYQESDNSRPVKAVFASPYTGDVSETKTQFRERSRRTTHM